MYCPSLIEINLKQFKKNLQIIKKYIGKAKYCLPVKSNSYGHGLIDISKASEDIVDYLAIARLEEGILLRENGIKKPIIVYGSVYKQQIEDYINYDLEFTISSSDHANWINEISKKLNKKAKIHLEIDTGLRRTGEPIDSALSLAKLILDSPMLKLISIYSHFATSANLENSFVYSQLNLFIDFSKKKII